ncbi:hypothetical protein [Asticcacaulis tiandongensis]|uniref:hypothetical protein n=1 Tax=Asticcacaulis tiandongensis TaxID=2565365 RepID=UPI00112ED175|nr:hypothetical protein [Asticcacaulis tiandongensis]
MRLHITSFAVLAFALSAGAASAYDSDFAVGVHAGTTGVGISAKYQFNDYFVLRGDYDHLDYSRDFNSDDVDYDGQLNFKPFTVAVDMHPFQNSFFVSAGYNTGDRKVKLTARPTSNTEIGGTTYTPEQIGTLTANADLGSGAPFVGLGFDNTFTASGSLSFRVLAGAIIGKEPELRLSSDGTEASNPLYQESLRREEADLQDDVDKVKTYPVLQIGVNWRF